MEKATINYPFKTIALVGKFMNQQALGQMQDDLVELALHLTAKNYQVVIEVNSAQNAALKSYETYALAQLGKQADLVIVMGGDGTMLGVARSLIHANVPLIGINRGRFGFLTDLRAENMLDDVDAILAGKYQAEPRMLLQAEIERDDKVIFENIALNDVVIKSDVRLIELEVHIDDMMVYSQRSDGLIVSTPTGTTAYSLSAGGPILHPNLHAITLVPVCPHTLTNRPITVHSSSNIEMTVVHSDGAQISLDGQINHHLYVGDMIRIKREPRSITLLHPEGYCYFDRLRNKLNWG
jgi:NAD+ kinase